MAAVHIFWAKKGLKIRISNQLFYALRWLRKHALHQNSAYQPSLFSKYLYRPQKLFFLRGFTYHPNFFNQIFFHIQKKTQEKKMFDINMSIIRPLRAPQHAKKLLCHFLRQTPKFCFNAFHIFSHIWLFCISAGLAKV